MPIKVQVPTKNQINELRNMFLEKYAKDPPDEPFHPVDLDRINNHDLWCQRFLEMYDLDMKASFDKLWETCIWRQKYGANELNESNLREDYLKDGVIFSHNTDLDGKPLLIFKTKLHIKGTKNMEEVMRVVVYWIERIHREHNMSYITIFFDMAGTGISSMDLDFVKGIIDTFKMYYPNALNYILIYEMAWVLNAAFKIVKGLLPPKAHEILKVISKKDINQYIDAKNCLTSWGGTDPYEFKFIPERRKEPIPATPPQTSPVADAQEKDKKVHFANNNPTRVEADMKEFDDPITPQDHEMLRIVPNEYIIFSREENTESSIEISSLSKIPITYKIQTTSPAKFRVRPRCGFIMPGETIPISILLKHDHQLSETSKDKFLVMSMAVPPGVDTNIQQPAELWLEKTVGTKGVEQNRLICTYKIDDLREAQTAGPGTVRPSCATVQKARPDPKSFVGASCPEKSKQQTQLENPCRSTQISQWITWIWLALLSIGLCYLLMQDKTADGRMSVANKYEMLKAEHDKTCQNKIRT